MRAFVREFKEFISRGNVLDLAVGVVIGIAFTTMVNSFVNDILNAFIGAVVGKPNFDDLTITIGDGVIRYGAFLTAVVNFLIVAFALFLVVKAFNTFRRKEEDEPQHTEKDVLIEIRDLLRVAVDGDEPAPPTPRPQAQHPQAQRPQAPRPQAARPQPPGTAPPPRGRRPGS
jgi:large conductance mechanosensitive channel